MYWPHGENVRSGSAIACRPLISFPPARPSMSRSGDAPAALQRGALQRTLAALPADGAV